jgi:ribosomal protein L32
MKKKVLKKEEHLSTLEKCPACDGIEIKRLRGGYDLPNRLCMECEYEFFSDVEGNSQPGIETDDLANHIKGEKNVWNTSTPTE